MHTPQPLHCEGSVEVDLDVLYRIVLFPKFPLTPALSHDGERGLETEESNSSQNSKKFSRKDAKFAKALMIISVGATLRGCPECGRPQRAAPTKDFLCALLRLCERRLFS
jgi:hypothetical protein